MKRFIMQYYCKDENMTKNKFYFKLQTRGCNPVFGNIHAFTLAEVLITLAVIGVVAALTLPTLIKNNAKQETVAKLQKVYSTLSQTTERAVLDNGPIETWFSASDYGTGAGSLNFANIYMIPYLKITKNCGIATNADCSEIVHYMGSNNTTFDAFGTALIAKFYLSDGTFVGVNFCDQNRVMVHVDLNGPNKGPNTYGKDVFVFDYLSSGQLISSGEGLTREQILDTATTWGCNKGQVYSGQACTYLIIMDGWQIKDDYPW